MWATSVGRVSVSAMWLSALATELSTRTNRDGGVVAIAGLWAAGLVSLEVAELVVVWSAGLVCRVGVRSASLVVVVAGVVFGLV